MRRLNQALKAKLAWIDIWSEAVFAGIFTAIMAGGLVAIYILASMYYSIIHTPGV